MGHEQAEFADFYLASRDPCLRAVTAVVGDRELAARALARAWLARRGAASTPDASTPDAPPGSGCAVRLPVASSAVTERARALLAPPPRPRRLLAAGLVGLTVLTGSAAVIAGHDTEHRFEQAQSAYRLAAPAPAPH